MSYIAIRVQALSKQYRLGQREPYKALRDSLARAFSRPIRAMTRQPEDGRRSSTENLFWALQDVSLEIAQGDAVGIIGSNGAGKSTFLKILSRITEPTSGRATLRGRVGSLLEVGAGFHSELTGRENVYLSGAILGMKKLEIDRKFDEIIDFASVENFVDTPVKRYSSGMYVRLAFAVAAHLEPEILLIDEVLAVGDANFQKKCLGKMGEVGREGRTVLFVSHNMASIRMLCSKAVLLDNGRVKATGLPDAVISDYLTASSESVLIRDWPEASAPGDEYFRLLRFEVAQNGSPASDQISTSGPLTIKLTFAVEVPSTMLQVGFELETLDGVPILQTFHSDHSDAEPLGPGVHCLTCEIPRAFLNQGMYVIRPLAALYFTRWILDRDSSTELRFRATLEHSESALWHVARRGILAPYFLWSSESVNRLEPEPRS